MNDESHYEALIRAAARKRNTQIAYNNAEREWDEFAAKNPNCQPIQYLWRRATGEKATRFTIPKLKMALAAFAAKDIFVGDSELRKGLLALCGAGNAVSHAVRRAVPLDYKALLEILESSPNKTTADALSNHARNIAMVAIGWLFLLRGGEVTGIHAADVNLKLGEFVIRNSKTLSPGETRRLRLRDAEVVPNDEMKIIAEKIPVLINDWLGYREDTSLNDITGLLFFPDFQPNKRCDYPAFPKAALPPPLTSHSLRRGGAQHRLYNVNQHETIIARVGYWKDPAEMHKYT